MCRQTQISFEDFSQLLKQTGIDQLYYSADSSQYQFLLYLGPKILATAVCRGTLQFLSSYFVGVFVWGIYMPEEFLGLTMTSPWFYSFLYNILWAVPNIVMTTIVFALLYRSSAMRKYLTGTDLQRFA